MKAIEVESKFELSKEDFYYIKEICDLLDFEDQLNIYFDHKFKLANRAITFRVRLYHNRNHKITMKIPIDKEASLREAVEFEYDLPSCNLKNSKKIDVDENLPVELKNELEKLHIDCLSRLGYMRTHRWKMRMPNGSDIELDEVFLPNGENFFEVEIEDENYTNHEKAINYILDNTKSSLPSEVSKFERFAKALRERESTI